MTREVITVMNVTNPMQSRYLTFYAAVASWAKYCDRVIVVDGWSDESLLDIPKSLFGQLDNVEIIRNEITFWGRAQFWHAFQSGIGFNEGMLHAGENKIVFAVAADHVLYPPERPLADYFPATNTNAKWYRFYRSKFAGNQYKRRLDTHSRIFVNNSYAHGSLQLMHGYNLARGPSDFPISPSHKTIFRDPVTGSLKAIYAGREAEVAGIVDIECGAFGHFWYDVEMVLEKITRWNIAFARYLGIAPSRRKELVFKKNLQNIQEYVSKDKLLGYDLPPAMNRLIAEFYEPGMLGGAIYWISPVQRRKTQALRTLMGLERLLRTFFLRARGYRGLHELHQWVPLNDSDLDPLDVRSVYMEQDKYLPLQYRIDWDALASTAKQQEQNNRLE